MLKRLLVFIIFLFMFAPLVLANNFSASAITLTGKDMSNANQTLHTWDIQLNIRWEGSWCDSGDPCNGDASTVIANHDAVWLFAKFSKWDNSTKTWGEWTHALLSKTDSDHNAPSGSKIDVGCTRPGSSSVDCSQSDATGVGVFFYRGAANAGSTFSNTGVKLRWLYGQNSVLDTDRVKIRIFGIEMVYIPAGSFYAGDNATSTAAFKTAAGNTAPWHITSEAAISVDNSLYYYVSSGHTNETASGTTFTIPLEFPKGYSAFYIMKTELSQGQYRDFLNTLNQTMQDERVAANISNENDANTYVMVAEGRSTVASRQTIKAGVNPADGQPYTFGCDLGDNDVLNESADGEWIAMNYVSWADNAAFAAWAGLRPFTELEYEKAARGPQAVVNGEYAWGNTTVEAATTTLNATGGTSGELPDQGNMNFDSSSPNGSFRVGSFADGIGSSLRQNAGASYYGVLDLSGNLWERPVTVGNATGRSFTGSHGNGVLSAAGNADVTLWPGTDAQGAGFLGGGWSVTTVYARVSDRDFAAYTDSGRGSGYGVRVSRTSP